MVTLPDTVSVFPTVSVEVFVPAPRVSDLQTETAVNAGWYVPVKLASPMIASTEAVGTPAVQLAAVAQAVLFVPFQEVCALADPAAMSEATTNPNRVRRWILIRRLVAWPRISILKPIL